MTTSRFKTFAAIAVALLAAATVLAGVSRRGVPPNQAEAAGNTPDMYIEVAGAPGCTTNNLSNPPDEAGDVVCTFALGEQFVVEGHVLSVAGLPDTDGDPGYSAAIWRLLHTSVLTLNNPAGTEIELGFPGPFWPDCAGMRSDQEAVGQYDIMCETAPNDESTFTGKIFEVRYTCSSPGQSVVTQSDYASYVRNESGGNQPIDKHGAEVLTIICLQGPTSTPTSTPTATPSPTPKNAIEDTDGDTTPNGADPDDDNDGCIDVREEGLDQTEGGLRNPHVFWDFFDAPDPVTNLRDHAVAGTDFFRILARFNSIGDSGGDPLATPPPPAYHTAYDRGPLATAQDAWDLTAANGSVAGTDFFAMLTQFGHNCV